MALSHTALGPTPNAIGLVKRSWAVIVPALAAHSTVGGQCPERGELPLRLALTDQVDHVS
jgi:hypothetical protein